MSNITVLIVLISETNPIGKVRCCPILINRQFLGRKFSQTVPLKSDGQPRPFPLKSDGLEKPSLLSWNGLGWPSRSGLTPSSLLPLPPPSSLPPPRNCLWMRMLNHRPKLGTVSLHLGTSLGEGWLSRAWVGGLPQSFKFRALEIILKMHSKRLNIIQ